MDFLRRKACPPQAGANTTATAKNHCTLFYSRDKDRSSSRRCGNEDIARIERQGCVCPVHAQKFILRIARIIRREPAWTPQGAQFFPQPPHLLHRMSTALCAGFQHRWERGFSSTDFSLWGSIGASRNFGFEGDFGSVWRVGLGSREQPGLADGNPQTEVCATKATCISRTNPSAC